MDSFLFLLHLLWSLSLTACLCPAVPCHSSPYFVKDNEEALLETWWGPVSSMFGPGEGHLDSWAGSGRQQSSQEAKLIDPIALRDRVDESKITDET